MEIRSVDSSNLYSRNPDFVHRRAGEEEILVPVRRAGSDLSCIYLLNPVGAVIWQYLEEPRTRSRLLEELVEEFEVDRETAEADLSRFLSEMESVEAVIMRNSP